MLLLYVLLKPRRLWRRAGMLVLNHAMFIARLLDST